jgi:hypothetical protein
MTHHSAVFIYIRLRAGGTATTVGKLVKPFAVEFNIVGSVCHSSSRLHLAETRC